MADMQSSNDGNSDLVWALVTYIAAFFPLALVDSSDFISYWWKPIRSTRSKGTQNLVACAIPAIIIILYANHNRSNKDYAEMLTAAIAAAFSLIRFCRSAWGLLQLECFRRWAARSVISLRGLGINPSFPPKEDSSAKNPNSKCEKIIQWVVKKLDKFVVCVFGGAAWICGVERSDIDDETYECADWLLVNNTIVDNQITHGSAVSFLKYGNISMHVERPDRSTRAPKGIRFIVSLLLIVVARLRDIIRNLFCFRRIGTLGMIPEDPTELWINWSQALVGQTLEEWVRDCVVREEPEEGHYGNGDENADSDVDDERFLRRRDYFAGEVLASAVLHIAPRCGAQGTISSVLLWNQWMDTKTDTGVDVARDIQEGRVTKETLLKYVQQTGYGLPYGAPQVTASSAKRVKRYRRDAYFRKMQRVVASMPDDFVDVLEKFTPEMLEWLTILLGLGFIGVKDHGLVVKEEERKEASRDPDTSDMDNMALENLRIQLGFLQDTTLWHEKCDGITRTPSTISLGQSPVVSQSQQLYIENQLRSKQPAPSSIGDSAIIDTEEDQNRSSLTAPRTPSENEYTAAQQKLERQLRNQGRMSPLCAFPSENSCFSCLSDGGNRHISKIGEHVDAWLALLAGDQIKNFVYKVDRRWKDSAALGDKELYIRQRNLETKRLEYQFADHGHKFFHLDQTITFMGYSMEYVRSFLLQWAIRSDAEEHPKVPRFDWTRSIPIDACQPSERDSAVDIGKLSSELSSELLSTAVIDKFREYANLRSVQVRMLYELQLALQKKVADADTKDDTGPKSSAAMMLCIASFPSVSISPFSCKREKLTEQEYLDVSSLEESDFNFLGGDEVQSNCTSSGSTRAGQGNPETIENRAHLSARTTSHGGPRKVFQALLRQRENRPTQTKEEKIADWGLKVTPVGGPQKLEIAFYFKYNEGNEGKPSNITVQASVSSEQPTAAHFSWNDWRDSFHARLEGFKQWQIHHGFLEHEASLNISTETGEPSQPEVIKIVETFCKGTGNSFKTWNWWKPFRARICKAELESFEDDSEKCFLKQFNNKELGLRGINSLNRRVWYREMHKEEWSAVTYEDASVDTLKHAALVIAESLGTDPPPYSEKNRKQWEDKVPELIIKEGERLCSKYFNRAVLLYEIAAIKYRHSDSLKKAIYALTSRSTSERKFLHALRILENFTRTHLGEIQRGVLRLVGDKSEMEKVNDIYERLVKRSRLHPVIISSYVSFLAMTPTGVEVGNIKNTIRQKEKYLRISFIRQRNYESICDLGNTVLEAHEASRTHENDLNRDYSIFKEMESLRSMNLLTMAYYNRAMRKDVIAAKWNFAMLLRVGGVGVARNKKRSCQLFIESLQLTAKKKGKNTTELLKALAEFFRSKDITLALQTYAKSLSGREGNWDEILKFCEQLRQGCTQMQNCRITEGDDLQRARSIKEAIESITMEIENHKSSDAMVFLASIYISGDKGLRDLAKARGLLESALEKENPTAKRELVNLLISNQDLAKGSASTSITGLPEETPNVLERALETAYRIAIRVLAVLLLSDPELAEGRESLSIKGLLEESIKQNDGKAFCLLGYLYENGKGGVTRDMKQAIIQYRRSFESEDPEGMLRLASLYHSGTDHTEQNSEKAVALLKCAVMNFAHINSLVYLGVIYREGSNTLQKDSEKARKCFEKASENNIEALIYLSEMLYKGEGGAVDIQHAERLLQQGIGRANTTKDKVLCSERFGILLANEYPERYEEARERFENAKHWDREAIDARFMLGAYWINGPGGVIPNMREGVRLLRECTKIPASGPLPIVYLAHTLRRGGPGIPPDENEAEVLLKSEALQDGKLEGALYDLALFYIGGANWFPRDQEIAKDLLREAIRRSSHAESIMKLSELLLKGDEKDAEEAINLVRSGITEHAQVGKSIEILEASLKIHRRSNTLRTLQWIYTDVTPDTLKASAFKREADEIHDIGSSSESS